MPIIQIPGIISNFHNMKTNSNKFTFYWLEDKLYTSKFINDETLKPHPINIIMFNTVPELMERLILDKKAELLSNDIGLILDLQIDSYQELLLPKSWSGYSLDKKIITQDESYDVGLTFYEAFILGLLPNMTDNEKANSKPFWNPPPPVIFLTVLDQYHKKYDKRIEKIKEFCIKARGNNNPTESYVEYVNKFEVTPEKINRILKSFNIIK